ncbi:DNA-binding protein [Variovorax arabinosiphilus]|uniref:DNA-binding protein n=1 Tax=Variovorax arabinosiphilus TaxID=3053498 RepID=UPI0025783A32|nr:MULTISPECIES: DNA-binding protein [unclassified Variovorax]MDM0119007.1 DNA-binding protein [Variovorax sp. J2L1-78]MDM0129433.1 DNA-binding protein [Variovorax sp. J2L1-63]MDM0232781.1 DNA-binding protein [Variovorax sp. J2R1-6]
MSTEIELQSDIESLRGRFTETRDLYREVCALLFFRYGITPTASKLYQFVRKGSMSAPAEALAKFWEDLRSKARVEIDHPDLPPELKTSAAEAIADLWRQATAAARHELAALRLDDQAAVEKAHDEEARARQAASEAQASADALGQQLRATQETLQQRQTDLEAERRAHAGVVARLQELQRHLEEARNQQERTRADFSAELVKAREAVAVANSRADAAERRALLDIDHERQARVKVDKQLEALRGQLAQTESRHRESLLSQAETITRLQVKADAAEDSQRELTASNRGLVDDLQAIRERLAVAQQEATQFEAEAQTLRALLERLSPPEQEPPQGALASKTVKAGTRKAR